MKGLQGRSDFGNFLSSVQRRTAERLAEIEQEDADRCAGCGGEDCVCCEYYQDRQKWVSPEELFAHEPGDPMYDDYDWCGSCGWEYDDEEEWEE